MVLLPYMTLQHGLAKVSNLEQMSAVDWVCKEISLKVLQGSFRPLRFPVKKYFPASLTHAQTLPLAVSIVFPFVRPDHIFTHFNYSLQIADLKMSRKF